MKKIISASTFPKISVESLTHQIKEEEVEALKQQSITPFYFYLLCNKKKRKEQYSNYSYLEVIALLNEEFGALDSEERKKYEQLCHEVHLRLNLCP